VKKGVFMEKDNYEIKELPNMPNMNDLEIEIQEGRENEDGNID